MKQLLTKRVRLKDVLHLRKKNEKENGMSGKRKV
jgi:hypothetical protein